MKRLQIVLSLTLVLMTFISGITARRNTSPVYAATTVTNIFPCQINLNGHWKSVRDALNTDDAGLLKNINEEGPKGHASTDGGPGAVDFNTDGKYSTGNYAYGICEGDKILAAHDGIVSAKCEGTSGSCNDFGGYVIRVKSTDGTKNSVYAHAQIGSVEAIGLQQGAFVTAGTIIGLIGKSGKAKGPHIHFWSNQGVSGNFQFSLSVAPISPIILDSQPLKSFWSDVRGDNFATATADGEASAISANYVPVRTEGFVLTKQLPGMVPLKLFWNATRQDNFTTATAEGEASAISAGYTFVRVEGYVFPEPTAGTNPLKVYWNATRQDNFTTATAEGEASAIAVGYTFVRIEGYIPQVAMNSLDSYWNLDRGDNFTTATVTGRDSAVSVGYSLVRSEGYIASENISGTVPLKLFWHSGRGDNVTTATVEGENTALAEGYTFVRTEGYIFPTPQPGTVPLWIYWSDARQDNFSTATAAGQESALAVGYTAIRMEGYVLASAAPILNNQPPNQPTLLTPANATITNSSTPTFTWSDMGDPDNGPQTARTFRIRIQNTDGTPASESGWLSGTSWTSPVLNDGTYTWQVQASDGAAESAWTGDWSLSITTSSTPPTPYIQSDYTIGGPGSTFSVTVGNVSPGSEATIMIREPEMSDFHTVLRQSIPANGVLVFCLYIPSSAAVGTYTVRVTVANGGTPAVQGIAPSSLTLELPLMIVTNTLPVTNPQQPNAAPIIQVLQRLYLPLVQR